MILPFTGDAVLTVPAKDYIATKNMYTCTYGDKLLNTSLCAYTGTVHVQNLILALSGNWQTLSHYVYRWN